MLKRRRPNYELRELLAEAGWTEEALARSVNQLGAEIGLTLRYDRTSVSHWLSGILPREPVRALVAEAFGRRLGRRLTIADAGFGDQGTGAAAGLWHPAGGLAAMAGLPADDSRAPPYSLAELAVPSWPGELQRIPDLPLEPDVTGAVEVAETLARVFAASDSAFGGGRTRRALAAYLSYDLTPRLAESARPALRRRLFRVAAELTYLCGFMCFDEELNGLGQRYYLAALGLAAEVGDQATYALTLRAMSVQAQVLGHHRQALQLAETAAVTGRAAGQEHQAFLLGQLAVAYAADQDRANAFASLAATERHLDRATSSTLIGSYHPASLAHQEAAVRALFGDRTGAVDSLAVSLRNRPAAERRARAITLARLAELQLRQGHLDVALSTWRVFLDDYPHLASGRADTALTTMCAMLRPYTRHTAARDILARSRSVRDSSR